MVSTEAIQENKVTLTCWLPLCIPNHFFQPAIEENEALPKVQLRNKNKQPESNGKQKEEKVAEVTQSALERAMGTLYEQTPEMEDNNEGKIQQELDHLGLF